MGAGENDSNMRPKDFDVSKLIEDLQGTCSSIEDHLPEGMQWEDLTSGDHLNIDYEIFLCADCGWWCEVVEMREDTSGENVCEDCSGNE